MHTYKYDKSKPNGQKQKNTDNSKFQEFCKRFDFQLTPLQRGLEKTVKYFIENYEKNPKGLKL
jgi:hypothetical protein